SLPLALPGLVGRRPHLRRDQHRPQQNLRPEQGAPQLRRPGETSGPQGPRGLERHDHVERRRGPTCRARRHLRRAQVQSEGDAVRAKQAEFGRQVVGGEAQRPGERARGERQRDGLEARERVEPEHGAEGEGEVAGAGHIDCWRPNALNARRTRSAGLQCGVWSAHRHPQAVRPTRAHLQWRRAGKMSDAAPSSFSAFQPPHHAAVSCALAAFAGLDLALARAVLAASSRFSSEPDAVLKVPDAFLAFVSYPRESHPCCWAGRSWEGTSSLTSPSANAAKATTKGPSLPRPPSSALWASSAACRPRTSRRGRPQARRSAFFSRSRPRGPISCAGRRSSTRKSTGKSRRRRFGRVIRQRHQSLRHRAARRAGTSSWRSRGGQRTLKWGLGRQFSGSSIPRGRRGGGSGRPSRTSSGTARPRSTSTPSRGRGARPQRSTACATETSERKRASSTTKSRAGRRSGKPMRLARS
ncbi:hypothetical protein DFJ74DRAFT_742993, partial [Hyaloraphidium curvatum]